jgi:hypothetical protein
MRFKALTQAVGVAMMVGILGLTSSPVASAATASRFDVYASTGLHGQLDTNPGNGFASWIWGYNPGKSDGFIRYQYYGASGDHQDGQLYVPPFGGTKTLNLSRDVWRIRACFVDFIYSNGSNHYSCSNWS